MAAKGLTAEQIAKIKEDYGYSPWEDLSQASFEGFMDWALALVPDDFDKRPGSLIYHAVAPVNAEMCEIATKVCTMRDDYAFPDTMRGVNLGRKVQERSVSRDEATPAIRHAVFRDRDGAEMDVPQGSRFGGGGLHYFVVEYNSKGHYRVECETPGVEGNQYFGTIQPAEYIAGLGTGELLEVFIPGQDEEDDDHLYQRYKDSLVGEGYGGNITDYKRWVNELPGVGGVRVYPRHWGGGTVRLVIIASDWEVPSDVLVDEVQTAIDPEVNGGDGLGAAPIGHRVTVEPVRGVDVEVATELVFATGYGWDTLRPAIVETVAGYLLELRQHWAQVDYCVVRVSQIETRILAIAGVVDIASTKINGVAGNLIVGPDEVAILEGVRLV